jgi:hypothetical protein
MTKTPQKHHYHRNCKRQATKLNILMLFAPTTTTLTKIPNETNCSATRYLKFNKLF